jgi:hypothetical protein
MPRCAARWETTWPSLGRSLMVNRSVAGPRCCRPRLGGPHESSSSRKARIAKRASADSEMPAARASIAKRALSPAAGRTVIETGVVPGCAAHDGQQPAAFVERIERATAVSQTIVLFAVLHSFWRLTPPSAADCARFAALGSGSFDPFGPNTSLFFGANWAGTGPILERVGCRGNN